MIPRFSPSLLLASLAALSLAAQAEPAPSPAQDDDLKPAPSSGDDNPPVKKTIPGEEAPEPGAIKRPDGKTIPKMEKLPDGRIKIGEVTIDAKNRLLSFPCVVNMNEGLIEYAVVLPFGKGHEALLVTTADPFHVTLAMKLLKMREFKGYFAPILADRRPAPNFVTPPRQAFEQSIVQIHARFKSRDGRDLRVPLSELIFDTATNRAMADGDWLYTDSIVDDKTYQASLIGDLIAIYNDRAAVINYCGPKHDNDEVWHPMPKRVPDVGQPVTLEISLPEARPGTQPQAQPADSKPADSKPEGDKPAGGKNASEDSSPPDKPAGPWG